MLTLIEIERFFLRQYSLAKTAKSLLYVADHTHDENIHMIKVPYFDVGPKQRIRQPTH